MTSVRIKPALHEPQSYRSVNVGIRVCFVTMYLVYLLHKLQLCWHPLCLRSLVYKGLNGSWAERKANGYWWLLTLRGLRWSNFPLFPRCLTVNSVCQECVYKHGDLWTKPMLNKHTINDCRIVIVQRHTWLLYQPEYEQIQIRICLVHRFLCVNLPCKISKYLEERCSQIKEIKGDGAERAMEVNDSAFMLYLVCTEWRICMYEDLFNYYSK